MNSTTEIMKIKRGLNFRKEMLVQSKLEYCSGVISEAVDLGFRSALYGWEAKT